jgi:anti-anti-sigma factor
LRVFCTIGRLKSRFAETKMKMDVTNVENGIVKVVLTGSMNIQGSWDVEPKFITLVRETDKVVIDLTGVTFMSSAAMRVLVVTAKALREKGGKLVLAGPQGEVENTLKTVRLDTIISIVPDVSAAIALFR